MNHSRNYYRIKRSVVKAIFSVMLTFVLCSIGLTVTLFSLYNQYMQENSDATDRIIFGVNSGLLGFMLLVIISIPIVLVASKKMANPILEINKVAISLSRGDFTKKANESYKGEIGQLASSLNKLSDELSMTINSLTYEKNLLSQILNSMSDALIEFDVDMVINIVNEPFYELFEIKEYSDLPFELQATFNKIVKYITGNHRVCKEKIYFDDKVVILFGSPILNERSEVTGIVILSRDITEAERLEQTRRDYVANVSHELRSPLTAVKGLIIPLKEGLVKTEKDKANFYEIIFNEVERLNRLVNDLFELSRLQNTQSNFKMKEIDVRNILYEQRDKFQIIAIKKHVDIRVKTISKPIIVLGDFDRINQVITILIDNAIKFCQFKSTITLSINPCESYICIDVHNTGSFIDEKNLHSIFERFYKVDKTHGEEGAGLGLSIAKEVMNKLQGSIHATSDGIDETCFTIKLKKSSDN